MNWYYEKEGVSHGPCPEAEIITLVRRKQVVASTLVWNPGLEEWDAVEKLKPEWLEQADAPVPPEPIARQTVPRTEGPLPSSEAAPATPLSKPKAGMGKSAAETAEKKGLFGRLFGRGKK
ncbi:MAG: hypothetical protein JWO89_866 [Verrucomicrobiaceae bacterium]|nr:hypothetical protein [Verrucomicrobiaceae bacterium]